MARFIQLLCFGLTLGLFVAPIGCGGDGTADTGEQATTTTDGADDGADGSLDDGIDIPEPCPGLRQDKPAKEYNDECVGIEECTQMPENKVVCFCAYCGPVGGKIECLQAQCPQAGGG